jgi:heterodisulfide reductase subunit C
MSVAEYMWGGFFCYACSPQCPKQEDSSPLIAFARSYDGTSGAWFKTN